MSAQTFGALCLAETAEEKEFAERNHREAVASAPSDAEIISTFLNDCQPVREHSWSCDCDGCNLFPVRF